MIVYFTGTGNSRYCAQFLSAWLGDELLDSFRFIRDGVAAELCCAKPWVFVAPTYSWRLPRVFEAFLRSGSFQGSRAAYFVMSCGSEIGNAAAWLRRLCEEKGLEFRGVLPVVMPENYIALFNAPLAQEAARIIAAAAPTLEAGAACIREGRALPAPPAGLWDRLKSGPINPLFYTCVVKAGPFRVTDACTGCGKCEKSCPLGNIRLDGGKPVWGSRCTHCMACLCGCPQEAVEYGRKSIGQPRYQCPPYRE